MEYSVGMIKNAIPLSLVVTILMVGCSQEPTVQTPPQEHQETTAELKTRAEAVFNARQKWIKEAQFHSDHRI